MTSPPADVAALLLKLGDALGTAIAPTTLAAQLAQATASVRSLFSAAACSCALVEPDGATLRFVAADGQGAKAIVGITLPIERGIAGWVALSGQPIVVSDVAQDARFARDIAEATNYVPQSIMAAPMVDQRGEVSGVVEVLDPRNGGEHTGRDLEILTAFAQQFGSIVSLCSVYDGLGAALLASTLGATSTDDFGAALAALAEGGGGADVDLARLAATFQQIAATGPEGLKLAETVLREVIVFSRARR